MRTRGSYRDKIACPSSTVTLSGKEQTKKEKSVTHKSKLVAEVALGNHEGLHVYIWLVVPRSKIWLDLF